MNLREQLTKLNLPKDITYRKLKDNETRIIYDYRENYSYCEACNQGIDSYEDFKYCPYCGKKIIVRVTKENNKTTDVFRVKE